MGGNKCCVDACGNYSGRNNAIVFHSFPSNLDVRQRWIAALRAINNCSGWIPARTTVLCSDHFSDDSYEQNITARLSLGLSRKGCKLRPDAVPSLFLLRKRAAAETWGSCTSTKELRLAPAEDAVRDNHWPIQLPGASTKVTTSTQTYSACSNRSCQAMPDYRTRGTLAFPDRRSMGTQSFIDSRNKGCQAFMHDAQDTKDQTPKRRRQRLSSVGCQADIKPNDHKSTQTDSKDIFTGPQSEAVMHSSGDPSHGPSVSSEQHGTVRSSISDDGEVTASCQGTQYAVISSSAQETSQSATGKTLAEETNYVVSRTQLLEALQFCRDCGTTECQVQLSTMGTLVHAVITCKRSHARTWHSQRSHCNK